MGKANDTQRWILITAAAVALAAAGTAHAGYAITTLASFNGLDGEYPLAGLILSGNTFYGTTAGGGANGDGTVFSVPITGGIPTVLASFNGANGKDPYTGLTLVGNTLYGTTSMGGASGDGTVFSIPITGGTPIVLAPFNGSNGKDPQGGLILSGNTLYGTTVQGGANNLGTVFSVRITGGTPTVLASFNGSNGESPAAGLTLSGNTVYGTTVYGGAGYNPSGGYYGDGTVFSVPITGGTPTVLVSFNGSNGANPYAVLTLSDNTLYGTTQGAGAPSDGTVFSVPITGGTPAVLASFNGSNGQWPQTGLTLSGNTLYGDTPYGGANNEGTVFSVPINGGTPTVLVSFNGSNGANPYAVLTLSGNTLYGTTEGTGAPSDGTVFALTPNPIISLTVTAPAASGSQVGTLAVLGGNGKYIGGTGTFTATPTGYVAVSGFNPANDTENYALHITDSVPANLAADLADAASEINAFTYTGYNLTASTTDPTGGSFGSGYNFFLTITDSTMGSSPYLGFDFTQLNGINDTLSVNEIAVPEPTSLSLLIFGGLAILRRRK